MMAKNSQKLWYEEWGHVKRSSVVHKTSSRVSLLALFLVSLSGASCVTCDLQPCEYTLEIDFQRQGDWESGTWDIVLEESDTRVGSCTIELAESPSSSNTSCTKAITLEQSDGGRGVDSVEVIYEFTEDSQVALSVQRNGEQVTQSTLSPNFQPAYPNGRQCGAACLQATVQYAF
jgi:hypothetical protein